MRGNSGAFAAGACVALATLGFAAAPAAAASIGGFSHAGQLAVSSDGAHVYAATPGTTVAFTRDPDSGAVAPIASYAGGGNHVELSPDQRHAYVLGEQTSSPRVINVFARDPVTGGLTKTGSWASSSGTVDELEFRDDGLAYATDERGSALLVLARDPASGALTLRRELRDGQDGVDLAGPSGMAVAPGRLYVSSGRGIRAFSLADDGDPAYAANPACECDGDRDLALVPGGSRLIAGPHGPYVFDRDPSTGSLSRRQTTTFSGGGELEQADGGLAVSANGADVYAVDTRNNRLVQLRHGPEGLTLRREYLEGADGQGIGWPRAVALSPDGRHLYLSAGPPAPQRYSSNLSVFRRDPDSGELTFVQVFGGPNYRDPAESGSGARVTINGGAEYTNDRDVVLTVTDAGSDTTRLEISNDGGFRPLESRFVNPAGSYPWRLATSGPEQLPKTVYVRLASSGPGRVGPFSDSIVLDERAPRILAARLAKPRRLKMRATDAVSGVAQVQVSRNVKNPGRWRRFSRTVAAPKGRGQLRVRVRDRAGNRSKWRRVG